MKGEVRLRVTIKPEGTVSSVCLVSGLNALADRYTAQAAEHWRFTVAPDTPREAELSFTFAFEPLPPGNSGGPTGSVFKPPFSVTLFAAIPAGE